jgi:adenylate cyclase
MRAIGYSLAALFTLIALYLFVSAPPPLSPELASSAGDKASIRQIFETANSLNGAARITFTKRIVGPGKKVGLKFGEDWAEPDQDKGPLPALFLRLVAAELEKHPLPLGLYLGSDEPINASNLFTGAQLQTFNQLKETGEPQYLQDGDARMVAMYPDVASAVPCVSCHNEHVDSPKKDWELNDMMGATTWTFPNIELGQNGLLEVADTMLLAIYDAYDGYLQKARGFSEVPEIGTRWPEPGQFAIPNKATFMAAVRAQAALPVFDQLFASRVTP